MLPVVIAYENSVDQQTLKNVIEQAGCTPRTVDDLIGAINVLREAQAPILIMGESFDGNNALDIIPIFRHLQKDLKIVLLADSASMGFLRQARTLGIFYHALEPHDEEDCQEIQLALQCARDTSEKKHSPWKELLPTFGNSGPDYLV